MKPILTKWGIGEGAGTMDFKNGRTSYYIRLGKIFRNLRRLRLGFLGLSHVERTMGKKGWSSQPSIATPAWIGTTAISFFGVVWRSCSILSATKLNF